MGGNDLHFAFIRRYQKTEYFAIGSRFRALWPLAAFSQKESFGNLDLLFTPPSKIRWRLLKASVLKIVKNGDVTALIFKSSRLGQTTQEK
jgi:hypothetical protein